MPIFKNHTVFEIARGVKAFFSLQAGVTRGVVPDHDPNRLSEQIRKQLAAKDRQIAKLKASLEHEGLGEPAERINAENLIWIFCTSRSGSTWLYNMLEDLEDHTGWHEPLVGELFGNFYYVRNPHRKGKHYIMGGRKETWLKPLRSFVLDAASAKFPEAVEKGYLAIKEPASAIGAPLIMEALPESRMIFLVRDPRDVAASSIDAHKKGSWFRERRESKETGGPEKSKLVNKDPNAIVESNARKYLLQVSKAKQAYEAHEGPKVLVKYEDLRVDTLGTMKHAYFTLGVPVNEKELAKVVEKHSWENIPESKKGEGKFYRKATPGGWREDLSPNQVEIVEEITAPLIEAFYPDERTD